MELDPAMGFEGVIVGTVGGILAIIVLAGSRVHSPVQRLAQISDPTAQNGGSLQDRLAIAGQAWPRIWRDPVVGTGLDTSGSGVLIVSHANTAGYQIHGLPLAAWYQTGIFGLLGILGLLAALLFTGWQSVALARGGVEMRTGLALLCALVAFAVFAMTQPMVFQQYGWVTAALIVSWRVHRSANAVSSNAAESL